MFSCRTNWNFQNNRITKLIQEYQRNNISIIDLSESNPTKVGFNYPEKFVLKDFCSGKNLIYNPHPKGLINAREAICKFYHKKNINIHPESIIITAGSSDAYNYIFRLIAEPGDEILVPSPSYPLLQFLSRLNDISIKNYRLLYDGEWHIDIDSIYRNITNKTKAILFIHPNNPTGSYVKNEEYEKVLELANRYGLIFISDEVFYEYEIEDKPNKFNSFSEKSDILTFTINGISKLLGLSQMKLGWVIVSGPNKLKQEAINRLEIISDTFLSVNTPVQNSLPIWLENYEELHNQIKHRVIINYFRIKDQILANSAIELLNVEGGWNGILRFPNIFTDEQWVELFLKKYRLFLQPGYFYDFERGAYLLVSLLLPENIIKKNIIAVLDEVKSYL